MWDTGKVKNMNGMFNKCKNIKSLPDISKWNTSNVIDMESMFMDCESLKCLPEISKWNTNNVKDISFIFKGCITLSSSLSKKIISEWNLSKETKMEDTHEKEISEDEFYFLFNKEKMASNCYRLANSIIEDKNLNPLNNLNPLSSLNLFNSNNNNTFNSNNPFNFYNSSKLFDNL